MDNKKIEKKDETQATEGAELTVKVTKRTKIRTDVKAGPAAPPGGVLAK